MYLSDLHAYYLCVCFLESICHQERPREWLGTAQATNHYLNQCWCYSRIKTPFYGASPWLFVWIMVSPSWQMDFNWWIITSRAKVGVRALRCCLYHPVTCILQRFYATDVGRKYVENVSLSWYYHLLKIKSAVQIPSFSVTRPFTRLPVLYCNLLLRHPLTLIVILPVVIYSLTISQFTLIAAYCLIFTKDYISCKMLII